MTDGDRLMDFINTIFRERIDMLKQARHHAFMDSQTVDMDKYHLSVNHLQDIHDKISDRYRELQSRGLVR